MRLNDPDATRVDLERAKDLADAVNQHDEDNPDCDTETGRKDDTETGN